MVATRPWRPPSVEDFRFPVLESPVRLDREPRLCRAIRSHHVRVSSKQMSDRGETARPPLARAIAVSVDRSRGAVDRRARRSSGAWTAAFGADAGAQGHGAVDHPQRWRPPRGIRPASIHDLYMAMGRGEAGGFTVPAINVRAMAYDTARAVIRAAKKLNAGAFIFEIARSEIGYTEQRPHEYAAVVLGRGAARGLHGPAVHPGRPRPDQREEVQQPGSRQGARRRCAR